MLVQNKFNIAKVIGPKTEHWLKQHNQISLDNSCSKEEVFELLLKQIHENKVAKESQLIELIDELIAIDKPLYALKIIDENLTLWTRNKFEGVRSEGIAAMLSGENKRALLCFEKAIILVPNEPSSYVNISKILCDEKEWNKAFQRSLAGLDVAKNHQLLWETIWYILNKKSQEPLRDLKKLASNFDSWAGSSLICALEKPNDLQANLEVLKKYHAKGEKSTDFLLEYTGILGSLEDFKTIETVLWQAEQLSGTSMPWQLQIHKIQALAAQEKNEDFLEQAESIVKNPLVSKHSLDELQQLIKETKANLEH
jgi:tetratricopeptide (TPR) repeat protein